jgi:hypothetical protein
VSGILGDSRACIEFFPRKSFGLKIGKGSFGGRDCSNHVMVSCPFDLNAPSGIAQASAWPVIQHRNRDRLTRISQVLELGIVPLSTNGATLGPFASAEYTVRPRSLAALPK